MTARRLRPPIAPRGLSREQAAAYVGVSPNLFDAMIADGRMPRPKTVNSRRIWDLHALDEYFDRLPDLPSPDNPDKDDLDTGDPILDEVTAI